MKKSAVVIALVAGIVLGFALGSYAVDRVANQVFEAQEKVNGELRESNRLLQEENEVLLEGYQKLGIDPYKDQIVPPAPKTESPSLFTS